jgi:hypothetical protein
MRSIFTNGAAERQTASAQHFELGGFFLVLHVILGIAISPKNIDPIGKIPLKIADSQDQCDLIVV